MGRFYRDGGRSMLSPSAHVLGAAVVSSIFPFTTLAAGTTGDELRAQTNWTTLGDATDAAKIKRNGSGRFTFTANLSGTGFPVVDTLSVNHSIAAPIFSSTIYGGLVVGMANLTNYLLVNVDASTGSMYIHKVEGGAFSGFQAGADGTGFTPGDTLKLVKHTGGTLLNVLRNATVVINSFAVPTAMQAGTMVSLGAPDGDNPQVGDITVNNV